LSNKKGKAAAGIAGMGGVTAGLSLAALAFGATGVGLPIAAALGGLGLVGGLGYLAYKKYKDNPVSKLKKTQRNISRNDRFLGTLLAESLNQRGNITAGYGSDRSRGVTGKVRDGTYDVNLDESINDHDLDLDAENQRYLFHELTHARVDQTYTANTQDGGEFMNLTRPTGQRPEYRTQSTTNQRKLREAKTATDQDVTLSTSERTHIKNRLDYALQNLGTEVDTVINELVLYLHQRGIANHSRVALKIRGIARDNYNNRNP